MMAAIVSFPADLVKVKQLAADLRKSLSSIHIPRVELPFPFLCRRLQFGARS